MSTPSALALLGGRWAFSVRVWAFLALINQIATMAWAARMTQVSSFTLAVPGLAGALAMGVVFLIANRATRRSGHPGPTAWPAVLVGWCAAFLMRSVAFEVSVYWISGSPPDQPLVRLATSTFALLGWALVTTYYLSLGDFYRRVCAERSRMLGVLRQLVDERGRDLDELRDTLAQGVETTILPALRSLEDELESLGDDASQRELLALSESADNYARQLVRNVSRQVADSAIDDRRAPSDNAPETPVSESRRMPWALSTTWAPVIALMTMLPLALSNGGLDLATRALAGIVPWIAVIVLLSRLSRAIQRRTGMPSAMYVILANLTAVGIGLLAQVTLTPPFFGDKSAVALTGFWLGILFAQMIAMALERNLARLKRESEDLAEESRQVAEWTARQQEDAERLRRQISQALHGPVQGRLAAVALALRLHVDALASGRPSTVSGTVKRCRALLEQVNRDIEDLRGGGSGREVFIDDHLAVLAQRWAGLIDLRSEVSGEARQAVGTSVVGMRRASVVIEDAINNACTHGGARSVVVRVDVDRRRADTVVIRVTDDGVGPPECPALGMGLGQLEGLGASWTLTKGLSGRTELEVCLPLSTTLALDPVTR